MGPTNEETVAANVGGRVDNVEGNATNVEAVAADEEARVDNEDGNEPDVDEEDGLEQDIAVYLNHDKNVILVDGDDNDSCADDEEHILARKNVQEVVDKEMNIMQEVQLAAAQDIPGSDCDDDEGMAANEDGITDNEDGMEIVTANEVGDVGINFQSMSQRPRRGIEEESEYYDSSDEAMSIASDEDGSDADTARRRVHDESLLYDPSKPWSGFFIGQEFYNVKVLRGAINRYSILKRYKVAYKKNDKQRVQAKCCTEGCKFKLFCSFSKTVGRFIITTCCLEHTCKQVTRNRRVTSKVILEELRDIIECVPSIKAKTKIKLIWLQLKTRVTVDQCKKAKQKLFREKTLEFDKEYADWI